jgi:hypothetical protein
MPKTVEVKLLGSAAGGEVPQWNRRRCPVASDVDGSAAPADGPDVKRGCSCASRVPYFSAKSRGAHSQRAKSNRARARTIDPISAIDIIITSKYDCRLTFFSIDSLGRNRHNLRQRRGILSRERGLEFSGREAVCENGTGQAQRTFCNYSEDDSLTILGTIGPRPPSRDCSRLPRHFSVRVPNSNDPYVHSV